MGRWTLPTGWRGRRVSVADRGLGRRVVVVRERRRWLIVSLGWRVRACRRLAGLLLHENETVSFARFAYAHSALGKQQESIPTCSGSANLRDCS